MVVCLDESPGAEWPTGPAKSGASNTGEETIMRKARTGRIRILGPGGVFLSLDEKEQAAVKAIENKEGRSRKAKGKPAMSKQYGKVRAFREYDYTKKG